MSDGCLWQPISNGVSAHEADSLFKILRRAQNQVKSKRQRQILLDIIFFSSIIENDFQFHNRKKREDDKPRKRESGTKNAKIMLKEIELFKDHLRKINLKVTSQRLKVLEAFLKTEKHLSCEELFLIVHRNAPEVGYTTVYRTLKLIQKSGLAREVDFGDRVSRLEHEYGHQHHDHLICLKCGKFIEVYEPEIEALQEKLAKKKNFTSVKHKMEIFGYCWECGKK